MKNTLQRYKFILACTFIAANAVASESLDKDCVAKKFSIISSDYIGSMYTPPTSANAVPLKTRLSTLHNLDEDMETNIHRWRNQGYMTNPQGEVAVNGRELDEALKFLEETFSTNKINLSAANLDLSKISLALNNILFECKAKVSPATKLKKPTH